MFRAAIVGSLLCAITHCAEPNMAHAVKVEGVEVELRRPSQRDSKDVVKTAGEDEPKKSKKKSWWKTLTRTERSSESSLLNSKRSPGKSDGRNAHSEGSHVFRVIGTWGDESFMESKRRSSFSNLANRWSHGDTLPRRSSGSKGDSLLKSIFQKKKKTAGVTDLDLSASFGMWPTDSKDTPSSPISPGTLSTDEFFGKALDAYKLAPVTNGSSATHSNPSPASKPADPVEDVFCNYAVMHPDALCLYKQRGSDTFTDIFHHNFMTKETKTCPTFTFTPPELSGKDFGRKEISRAWKNALAHVKKARWQDTAVQTDLMKFSHVIIGTCDIAFPKDLKTDISALVVQPEHKGKLTLAFFTEPEQPQVGVEFTMVEPERHSSTTRTYYSYEPNFTISMIRAGVEPRAKVTVNNVTVFSAGISPYGTPTPQIIKDKVSQTPQGQFFFFYHKRLSEDPFAMMKYQGKSAILHYLDSKLQLETTL